MIVGLPAAARLITAKCIPGPRYALLSRRLTEYIFRGSTLVASGIVKEDGYVQVPNTLCNYITMAIGIYV
jgi:hypothetical protein